MRRDEDLTAPAAFSVGETIVALSTARGLGAVAVVRLSGPEAWTVGRAMVAGRKKFDSLPEREMALFDLVDSSGEMLDRALAVKFRGPRSYTGEDVVEFHCHGGLAVTSGVIDAARAGGARSAMAGEFTRRAFLNGRMDLAQAEAVDSLVNARTAEGRRASLAGMNGALGEDIQRMRAGLLDLLAGLEYRIDFPDEATQETSAAGLDSLLQSCTVTLSSLLAGADRALLQARGAVAVIAGEPNVGKSSLFNCLLGEERSIVTASPGTTRDAIERELVIGGHLVRLVDTAGLRQSSDEAESKGVEYSGKYIASSDLVLFVHQAGNDLDRAEKAFLAKYKTGRLIRVANKADLYPEGVPDGFVGVSAKTGEGIEELKRAIAAVMEDGAMMAGSAKVTSLRQKKLLEESRELLGAIDLSAPPEMIASDLSEVCTRLGEITGQIAGEDVLEAIFSHFCLGK